MTVVWAKPVAPSGAVADTVITSVPGGVVTGTLKEPSAAIVRVPRVG